MAASSEIDDIFSGKISKSTASAKGKGKAADDLPVPSSSTLLSKKKKSKKRKRLDGGGQEDRTTQFAGKRRDIDGDGDDGDGDSSENKSKTKRARVVETVKDPSVKDPSVKDPSSSSITSLSNRPKEKSRKKDYMALDKEEKTGNDLERFKDSRGTGPRKRTEEGFLVYKENELGIGNIGGDTSLCPFDCNCCF